MDAPASMTLLDEAARKSGLIWLRPDGERRRAQAVWHLWHEGAAYVLSGGLEQPVPEGLGDRAFVTVRSKDTGARVLTAEAAVSVVPPGSPEWEAVEPGLVAKRLNLPDGEAAPQRWAQECTLYRLTPTGAFVETPDQPSTGSHATPPPPTPARSRVPRPLHFRGRPARNRGGH
jgi:hypothetical protein